MGTLAGIIAAVLLLVCLFFSGNRCFSQTPSSPPAGPPSGPPAATAAEQISSLDRKQIRALLKKLANTPPPQQTGHSFAMCYSTAPPPTRADYICPKCGERTVYDASNTVPPLEQAEQGMVNIVNWQVKVCRRDIQEIRKVAGNAISLDESQFCRKCSPKTNSPKLLLRISYKDGKNREIENVKHDDLRILNDFVSGKLLNKDDRDWVSPLKESLPRLQELLGEEPEK
jgi:hypothetical protein